MPRHRLGELTIRPHLVPAPLAVEPPTKPTQALFEVALLHNGGMLSARVGQGCGPSGSLGREVRPVPIEEAIEQEFGAYWLGDEIPSFSEKFVAEILPEWARHSAYRLRHAVGESEVEKLRAFLEMLTHDRHNPFIDRISTSLIEWADPQTWPHFVRILEIIRAELQNR
jgi:hypothetical protein